MHINTCSSDSQTAGGRALQLQSNSSIRALRTKSTIRRAGPGRQVQQKQRARSSSRASRVKLLLGQTAGLCAHSSIPHPSPAMDHHREAPCRLHSPGWFQAGFSQWGSLGRKLGESEPGCSQGCSPRTPLPRPAGSWFSEPSQSRGLVRSPSLLWKWFLSAANVWGASISHWASQQCQEVLH